jgi:hypothetical protein
MYDYGMNGFAGLMDDIKSSAGEAFAGGAGLVVGVSLAKFVTAKVDKAVSEMEAGAGKDALGYVTPAIPLVLGLALYAKFRNSPSLAARSLGAANGAGMIAFSLATYAKKLIGLSKSEGATAAASYIGLGAVDTYESPILAGLGNYGPISEYLRPSLGAYGMRSPGAPVFVEDAGMAGAPTQFQEVRGSVNGLHGAPSSIEIVPSALSSVLM